MSKNSSREADYVISRRFWSAPPKYGNDQFGVAPMGGCGLTEVLYRHYEECRHISRILNLQAHMDVLELGSGNGRWVISLAPCVRSYVAVDFSETMLDIARSRTRKHGLTNVVFCHSALEEYDPDRSFDVIYLSGVSQYLHDEQLKALLVRLAPSLNPGGVVVDRSTLHRRERHCTATSEYFSIYRTGDEVVGLFLDAALVEVYRKQSYAFLALPATLRNWLGSDVAAKTVRAAAPLSFQVLRGVATASAFLRRPTGELADFTHEFIVFRRPGEGADRG